MTDALEKLFPPTITAVVALFLAYLGYRRSIRPVLIFTRRGTGTWQLENVGNGPAVQIEVAYGTKTGEWQAPTLYYPLSPKSNVQLKRIPNEAWGLGVKYTDIHGKWYATECRDNINKPLQQVFRKEPHTDWLLLRTEGELEMLDAGRLTVDDLAGRMSLRQKKQYFEGAI